MKRAVSENIPQGGGRIQEGFSVYLDFWRALAAFMVLLRHGTKELYTRGAVPNFPYGHEAVVIFFVLSGFVISNVHRGRETDLRTFSLKRMSRIYSVFLPAIVLSMLLDFAGWWKNPQLYHDFSHPWHPSTLVKTVLFLGQNWTQNIGLGTNGALWSLHYEVWYYALFAAFVFSPTKPRSYLLLAALCLFVGPKILILMPCWLAGVAADRLRPPGFFLRHGKAFAFLTFLLFAAWFIAIPMSGFVVHSVGRFKLDDARDFLNDIPLSILMALHVMAARAAFQPRQKETGTLPTQRKAGALRWAISHAAGTSFTLYLLNLPVLHFLGAMFGISSVALWAISARMAATFAICLIIGLLVENKKRHLYQFFDRLFPKNIEPEIVEAKVH